MSSRILRCAAWGLGLGVGLGVLMVFWGLDFRNAGFVPKQGGLWDLLNAPAMRLAHWWTYKAKLPPRSEIAWVLVLAAMILAQWTVVGLLAGLGQALKRCRKHAAEAAVLTLFIGAALATTGCGGNHLLNRNRGLYQQVIDRILSGTIAPDQSGLARLPTDLQGASAGGEIYVSRPSGKPTIVVFKTWQGKGHNMEGFLFAAQPLGDSATSTNYYRQEVIRVGSVDLTLEKRPGTHWHKVSYKLDSRLCSNGDLAFNVILGATETPQVLACRKLGSGGPSLLQRGTD